MKIITPNKEAFEFNLRRGRTILLSTVPVEVSDEEFSFLYSRLGSQIQKVEVAPATAQAAPATASTVASAPAPQAPAPAAAPVQAAAPTTAPIEG